MGTIVPRKSHTKLIVDTIFGEARANAGRGKIAYFSSAHRFKHHSTVCGPVNLHATPDCLGCARDGHSNLRCPLGWGNQPTRSAPGTTASARNVQHDSAGSRRDPGFTFRSMPRGRFWRCSNETLLTSYDLRNRRCVCEIGC
jgi:hypothetical protein